MTHALGKPLPTRTDLKHPVIEIFGPTLQGEGELIGQPVNFVRFGGCDYRCSWCDTKYAVDPHLVKQESEMLTDTEILDRLDKLDGLPQWVVFSGGNPALQHLGHLVDLLHARGKKVTVETQGTIKRPWLYRVDKVTCSPKPPSSGNVTTPDEVLDFMKGFYPHRLSYKVVVFDDEDYEYLRQLVKRTPYNYQIFLSIGTDVGKDTREDLCEKWKWWAEKIAHDRLLSGCVRVLPQAHVLLWGHGRGF